MRRKVLLLFEYPSLNGGEHSMLTLLPLLREKGFRFAAAAPAAGPLADLLRKLDVDLHNLHLSENGRRLPREEIHSRIASVVESARPDLVHANSLSISRLSGPVTKSTPSLGHLRDIVRVSRRAMQEINHHDRLLAVSNATLEWHLQQGLDESKSHRLYNGVDIRRFAPTPRSNGLRRELSLGDDAILVGAVGQIGMRKGLDVLFEAASPVIAQVPQTHLVVVGARHSRKREAVEYESSLVTKMLHSPLRFHVHFVGVRDDVPQLLNDFDLLAHAARQEPFGRVLLEAAACGTAILTSDAGGTREMLNGEAARIVPVDDVRAFSEQLLELLKNPSLRRQLGANARSHVAEFFNAERAAAELARHYQATLEGSRV